MNRIAVVGDSLGKKVSKYLGVSFFRVFEREFPDTEIQPRIENEVNVKKAILILRKKRRERINDYIVKFFLISRKLKENCKKVIGVIPYLPYARQDKVFRKGEPLSNKYIAELLEKNLDSIITVSPHEHRTKISDIFSKRLHKISGFKILSEFFKEKEIDFVLGPDEESLQYLEEFCENLKIPFDYWEKKRDVSSGKIKIFQKKLEAKNLVIVDDIISTGKTIYEVGRKIRRKVKNLYIASVHGVFSSNSINILRKLRPKEIVCTDTIENPFEKISTAKDIAITLKRFEI